MNIHNKQNIVSKDIFKEKILEYPSYYEYGKYDFKGLSDDIRLLVVINAYNLVDLCPNSRVFKEIFGFSDKYLRELKKLISHRVKPVTVFTEDGYLCGKGYQLI